MNLVNQVEKSTFDIGAISGVRNMNEEGYRKSFLEPEVEVQKTLN